MQPFTFNVQFEITGKHDYKPEVFEKHKKNIARSMIEKVLSLNFNQVFMQINDVKQVKSEPVKIEVKADKKAQN